ncbi:MAG TPA: periplasmic heavy metal sensor [Thermoanaerobaculia bacterium]|nr:periplasmic heavy metal sensor [Thermoanaerobaculia bacterium]
MRRIAFAALALLSAGGLFAQQLPPGRWWRRPEIVQRLNLSAEQQDRLEAIFRSAAPDLIDLKAQVDKSNIALRGELDRTQLDRAAIVRIAAQLNQSRGKLFERELGMLVDMRSVLTDPQWERMRSELERLQERPRPARPPQ